MFRRQEAKDTLHPPKADEGKTEIIVLCQRLAEVSVGKIGMKELICFLKQCMIDKALGMAKTQKEASELLGLSSRRIFTYKYPPLKLRNT